MNNMDVIIIGGGVAGLSAGLHLAERGMHPLIFEADEKFIGGRLAGGETVKIGLHSFRLEHGVHGIWSQYRNLQAMLARHSLRPVFVPAQEENWIYKAGKFVGMAPLTEFNDLALKVGEFLNQFRPADFRLIMRSPIVAAMFATFNKVPTIAPDFWRPVADGVGFGSLHDPRLKLLNFCMNNSVGTGAGARDALNAVDVETYYRTAIVLWNAWRAGRELKVIRVPDTRPVVA